MNASSSASGGKNATTAGGAGAGGGAGAAAAAAAYKAQKKALAKMLVGDQESAKYLAVAVAGLIFLFTVSHWIRLLHNRKSSTPSTLTKIPITLSRMMRKILTRPLPGFTSTGDAVLIFAYVIINIALTVTNIQWGSLISVAKRCGWMALTNMAVITFLALKNTPLAFLTATSYERLNPLHQAGGYLTMLFVAIHAISVSKFFTSIGRTAFLLELAQQYGMVAGLSMFIMMLTALSIRKMRYEAFYLIHIAMFIVIVPMVALHQRSFQAKAIVITIFAGCIWSLDRIVRGLRIIRYSFNNGAVITPLPLGGTRITLRRSPSKAICGAHCFVWIPKIRTFETHPFTIVSSTPTSMELVVAAHDGFTSDLHHFAMKNPGASLRASIEGPYGAIPNFAEISDKVLLIAGGSGASFTFGVALDMIKKLGGSTRTSIDFIWCVKDQEKLSWYTQELNELLASPLINIFLHTTQTRPITSNSPSTPVEVHPGEKNLEQEISSAADTPTGPTSPQDSFIADPEKQYASSSKRSRRSGSTSSIRAIPGRPDVEAVIRDIVRTAAPGERVAIAACGPAPMMASVRRTAAECITVDGPSVTMHLEQFGW